MKALWEEKLSTYTWAFRGLVTFTESLKSADSRNRLFRIHANAYYRLGEFACRSIRGLINSVIGRLTHVLTLQRPVILDKHF